MPRFATDPQVGDRSGVAFSGESHDKAILTAHTVAQLQLRSPLVVLSACETALGEELAEGVLGIGRAFILGGADAVISSLWAVNDWATGELMQMFYERWLDSSHTDGDHIQIRMSVVDAWAETVRVWLAKWKGSREEIYAILDSQQEPYALDALGVGELQDVCYKKICELRRQGHLAAARHLERHMRTLKGNKKEYLDPKYWAAFSILAVPPKDPHN